MGSLGGTAEGYTFLEDVGWDQFLFNFFGVFVLDGEVVVDEYGLLDFLYELVVVFVEVGIIFDFEQIEDVIMVVIIVSNHNILFCGGVCCWC